MRLIITSIFLLSFAIAPLLSYGQTSKKELQQENKKITQEIAFTNKLLKEANKNKKASLNQLYLVGQKIKSRERLIQNIRNQIQGINNQINQNTDNIKGLSKELDHLKAEYAQMIYFAWKNRSVWNKWMFILAADDFNQAYQRIRYFQQYAEFREKQAALIQVNSKKISAENTKLERQKESKKDLIQNETKEKTNLLTEKGSLNNIHIQLSQKERELEKEIKAKQRQERKLQKKIKQIIAREIKEEQERLKKLKAENSNTDPNIKQVPLNLKLEKSFIANKGNLPWPVIQGFISSKFGKHAHSVLKNVEENNSGVDIITNRGQNARAIFNGTVKVVVKESNYNISVLIQHGKYFSFYSKLDQVSVKKGDQVVAGQEIGRIFSDPINGKTEMNLQIWNGINAQNPEQWIKKQAK